MITFAVWPLATGTEQSPQEDVDVGDDNEGRGQYGTVMEGHDKLISLELPHLVGDGLHLKEGITVDEKRRHKTAT